MLLHSFKYSLKVWLTSVAITPLIHLIFSYSRQNVYQENTHSILSDCIFMYCTIIVFQLLFSFVTWILFLIAIQVTVIFVQNPILKSWIIFITGIILTLGTFRVVLTPHEIFSASEFGDIALCTCFCIGWGSWFYKLEPTPEPEIKIN